MSKSICLYMCRNALVLKVLFRLSNIFIFFLNLPETPSGTSQPFVVFKGDATSDIWTQLRTNSPSPDFAPPYLKCCPLSYKCEESVKAKNWNL